MINHILTYIQEKVPFHLYIYPYAIHQFSLIMTGLVCEDQHGSDHFPVIIESLQHSSEDHNPKWKLNKADWDLFHSLCEESLTAVSLSDSIDPIAGSHF